MTSTANEIAQAKTSATVYDMPIYRNNKITGWSRIKIAGEKVCEMTGNVSNSISSLMPTIETPRQRAMIAAMQKGRQNQQVLVYAPL